MYIPLCGYPPFYGGDRKEIFAEILKSYYSLDGPEWSIVTEEAKDLIRKLLTANPNKRISAQ